jgi:hypothetical protein
MMILGRGGWSQDEPYFKSLKMSFKQTYKKLKTLREELERKRMKSKQMQREREARE